MNKLEAIVFIFQQTRKPFKYRCIYLEEFDSYRNIDGWKHTGTVDPAGLIEYFLNHPKERQRQIKSVSI